jgi:hypothetical protein
MFWYHSPIRMAVRPTLFILLSIPSKELPTDWIGHFSEEYQARTGSQTSKFLFNSAIRLEYSLSATLTLLSICSVLFWTSFLTEMSLSMAASKVWMNGIGSKAERACQGYASEVSVETYGPHLSWIVQ